MIFEKRYIRLSVSLFAELMTSSMRLAKEWTYNWLHLDCRLYKGKTLIFQEYRPVLGNELGHLRGVARNLSFRWPKGAQRICTIVATSFGPKADFSSACRVSPIKSKVEYESRATATKMNAHDRIVGVLGFDVSSGVCDSSAGSILQVTLEEPVVLYIEKKD